jgi:PPIC-type PPIASE domain
MAPLGAKAAQKLAKRFTLRAEVCFAQVITTAAGRKITPTERRDTAHRTRALIRMDTELRSCLTGSGYGGEAMVSDAMVKRWLAAGDCAGFARAAFTSRACFALSGVLDQVGYPAARPRSRPAPTSPVASAGATCNAPEPPTAQGHLAASHILIFYQGTKRAPKSITRSKAAARLLANRIAALARAPGASFASLAKRWSEGPSAPRGGRLGRFLPKRMVPPFSRAVARLCIGTVSGPVETAFGFHVIRRNKP